jgi:hypothetical protein
MMHGIEDPKLSLPRGIQDLLHVRNAVIRFGNSFDAWPNLAALGNEVVVRIDHQKRSELCIVCHRRHCSSSNDRTQDASFELVAPCLPREAT